MTVDVISKATGAITRTSGNAIDLDAPSIVRLNLSRAEVAGIERQGSGIIVHLVNGEDIRIADFYVENALLPHDLVLGENDGTLWAARIGDGAPRFSLIDNLDALMAAEEGGGSSLALPLALVGGLAAAGVAVAAASGGGDGDRDGEDDSSGNPASPGTGTVAPDREAPAAPTGTIRGDGGQISGRGEPGATVEVRDADGVVIGSTDVAADGSYAIPLSPPQANGQPLFVTQTDPADNISAATPVTAPDITAPSAPTAGISDTGGAVTGRGEAGANVTIRDASGTVIATATVAADGNYGATLSPAQANGGTLSVVQTDAAGNTSPAVVLSAPDITAPIAPTAAIDSAGATVTGRGEAGASVTIRDASGTVIATATVAADGTYGATLDPAQANGGTLSVIQTDPAGNTSPAVVLSAPDITAPIAPSAAIDSAGATVTGRGEAGVSVTIRDASGTVIATTIVAADGTYGATLSPAQANGGTLSVVQTDAAGNASPTITLPAPDVTAPPAPTAAVDPGGAVVTGNGEAGATVTVRDAAGTVIGTAAVLADGTYAVTLTPAQADGGNVSVVQTDATGNVSPATIAPAPDITAPPAPVAAIDATGTIVSGRGEAGSTVTIRDSAGATIGTAIVATDGTYAATLDPAQANGGILSVVQTDAAGNASPSVALPAPDITAPAAPSASIDGTGTTVTGSGEAGATVTIRDPAGAVIGAAVVTADGSYTITLIPAQANGGTLSVSQSDPAGNISPGITIPAPDVTAPAAPTTAIDPTGTQVTGTGEPGAVVRIADAAGVTLGTAIVTADGSYTTTLAAPQVNGERLDAIQTDAAGNASGRATTIAPDLTAPAQPTAAISADGAIVTGSGEPGARVVVADAAGITLGSASVAADGSYSVGLVPAQANGERLTVVQVDAAGNAAPSLPLIAPDITAPPAPVATLDPSGTIVSGTGEPGARIAVRDAAGTEIGSATIGALGRYTVVLATPQVDNQSLTVRQADAAGNVSPATPLIAPDATAPTAPTAVVAPDGATLGGTGEAGAVITVRNPLGVAIGSATVGADGSYTVPLSPAQVDGEVLTVRQADAAGNVSPPANATAPDLVADTNPDAPTAAVNANGDAVTGAAIGGAIVTLYDAQGTIIATGTANPDGSYSVALTPPRIDGETIRVTQTGSDGAVSAPATAIAPDLTAPAAPTATLDAAGAIVTGTGEAGATITVRAPDGGVIGTAIANTRGDYAVPLSPAQTAGGSIAVTQADAAGNVSVPAIVAAPDYIAPAAPTATVGGDGSVVTGSGEAGTRVTVRDAGGAAIGSGIVGPDGSFSVPLAPAQANGGNVAVTLTDAAGNASPPTIAAAPDITAPAPPTVTVDGDGLALSGTGEPGATVAVTAANGATLGIATVAADGSYTVTLSPPQANGEALSVVQHDAAGNASPVVTIAAPDVTAPTAPTAVVAGDGASVTGSGEPGAIVTITNPAGSPIGTATVAADGSYTATLSPPQTNGERLGATQADAAGNISGSALTIAPDLTAPGQPGAAISADGTMVGGTGEPGARIAVANGAGIVIGTAVVAADGSYTALLSPAQANGGTLTVSQTDAAGNSSAPLPLAAPDITAPPAPLAALDPSGAIVSGTGEAGARVTVRDGAGTILGTTVVGAQGSYSIALATPQIDRQALTVVQADAAGNTSPATPLTAPDHLAPAAPTAIVAADGAALGGTGEAGATVTVRNPLGVVIGTATVNADGSYTAVLNPPQVDGEMLTIRQSDAAGNVSPAATATAPDIVADTDPDAPTASVNADGTAVVGTAIGGAAITVYDANGTVIASGTADGDGRYAVALSPARVDGEIIRVTQTEADGDVSPPATTVAPDLTAPVAPTATIDATGTAVTGTGQPGATVTIRAADGTVIGTASVDASGNYAATLGTPQIDGETLSVRQTDAAGNASPPIVLRTPDFTAPDAPLATIAPDGASVTGSGEPDTVATVRNATGTVIGSAPVGSDGSFTVPLTPAQANGGAVSVTLADAAGNVSPTVTLTAPDITAPAAPTLTVADNGASATGTGEPGATITLRNPDGTIIATAPVAADGSYTIGLNPPRLNGELLSVTQADATGNVSPPATDTAPDTTAPAAPTLTVADNGASATGIGEPGAIVTLRNPDGSVIVTAPVAADGSYTIALAPPRLNGELLSVTQADATGNVSPPATDAAPDTTAPAAPTLTVADNGASATGTGEPGATVTLRNPDGSVIATAPVAADGSYTIALAPPRLNGELLSVTQADATGNVSPPATDAAPDTTAPAAPTLTVADNGASATGIGEPGAIVTLRNPDGSVIATAPVAPDGSYTIALAPPRLNGELLSVTQADATGNVSPPATDTAPDTTAPAAPTLTVADNGASATGIGEPGAIVTLRNPDGSVIATAPVATNGSFTIGLNPPRLSGELLSVTQADAAGNVSPPATDAAPDTTAPAAPSASISVDGTTVSGFGEAGATVTVIGVGGVPLGSVVVAANGSYTIPLTVVQGNGEALQVSQTDAAGNPSPVTPILAPDFTAPPPPTPLTVTNDGTTLTGTGEAGARVEVRNAANAVIGTGLVAADGGFTVTLSPPQAAGGTLAVTQADAAGNVSGAAGIAAPFDIRAFDNTDTASVDLLPTTAPVSLGSTNYALLVSLGLVNLQAEVLGVNNVRFSVEDGHSLDAVFTYGALASVGPASNYAVVVQRLEGTQWVAVSGTGPASLLDVRVLAGNSFTAAETLGPGEYRAFLTYQGPLGLGALGNLSVGGVDADFTEIGGATPAAATGNVITEAGAGGEIDVTGPGTRVASVTVNGVETAVAAGGTSIAGAYGALTINPDGSYSYTPNADAATIGRTDTFTYTLLDPTDGERESATLSIAIGSPDVTAAPVAVADQDVAAVTFANVVTTVQPTPAFTFASQPGGFLQPTTGSGVGSFAVAANAQADITINVVREANALLTVLPSYTLTVRDASNAVVRTESQGALANLPIGTGASFAVNDLPTGNYTYTVSSNALLGTFTTAVSLGSTTTFLNDFTLATRETVEGNLFDNDSANTPFAAIRVNAGGGFAEIGDTPVTLTGLYGRLTVDETGGYLYQPRADLGYSAVDLTDTFTYQLAQPNGVIATAALTVTIDVPADGVLATATASMQSFAVELDTIPLDALTIQTADSAAPTPHSAATGLATYDLFEGKGEIEDVLTQYLAMQPAEEPVDTPEVERPTMVLNEPSPTIADPLDFLVSLQDQDHYGTSANHVV